MLCIVILLMVTKSSNLYENYLIHEDTFPKYCCYNKFLLIEEIALEDYLSLHYGKCCVIGKVRSYKPYQFEITNIRLPNLSSKYSLPAGTVSIKLFTTNCNITWPIIERVCTVIGEVVLINKTNNSCNTLSSRGIHEQIAVLKSSKDKKDYISKLTKEYEIAINLWYIKEIDRADEPQLFVFYEQFSCTDFDDYKNFLTKWEYNADEIKQFKWTQYWADNGNDIILHHWNQKYKDYLQTPQLEDQSTETPNTEVAKKENTITDPSIDEQYSADYDCEQSWENLWERHLEEVYFEQCMLYNSIFNNYYFDLCKALRSINTKDSDEISDDECVVTNLESNFYELTSEEENLRKLGLPTAFGPQHSKTKTYVYPEKSVSSIFITDAYQEKPINVVDETIASIDDSNMDQIQSTNLHNIIAPTITKSKKKKNRNLKSVPQFILEDKDLLKYWKKRFSLFSLFDKGIRLDRESWFSVTPEKVAENLAKRLKCDIIIDAFCGCGGNTIQFAKTCRKVIAIDIDPIKVEMAKHNASIYGVADKIEFIVGDFLHIVQSNKLFCDVVFLSPPWGGPKYKSKKEYDIEKYLLPIGASELVEKVKSLTENIALFLPRNSNVKQIIKLAGIGNRCEIQHNYLDTRLVAITALYGEHIISNNESI